MTIDLTLLQYDGNVLDCLSYASLLSLSLFKLPTHLLSVDGETEKQNPSKVKSDFNSIRAKARRST